MSDQGKCKKCGATITRSTTFCRSCNTVFPEFAEITEEVSPKEQPEKTKAPGARDRDVGRPFILESKGWNIFRVWSIDFFHDPEAEYSRIVRLIENAKRKESQPSHQ